MTGKAVVVKHAANDWISVFEALPEIGEKVLATGRPPYVTTKEDRRIIIDVRTAGGCWTSDWIITHWLPIPPLPED